MDDGNARILLVGCGKMGGAILGALSAHPALRLTVIDPEAEQKAGNYPGTVTWHAAPDRLSAEFSPELVILAVKPQQMAGVLPYYGRFRHSVFLSIAAGLPLIRLNAMLATEAEAQRLPYAIVRAMPNLPASIGAGMSAAVASASVTPRGRELCALVLSAIGRTVWLENEALMDSVTALSGSGPAYVFALCECMASTGEAMGLPPAMAAELARQTIVGSGALLAQTPESPEALRHAVTSPGGTTEAALKILLGDPGLSDLLARTMAACSRRAKELAG